MAKKFKRVLVETPISELKPLGITCNSTKCLEELHCYNMTKTAIKKYGGTGLCRDCGDDNIDWERLHKNDISDIDFIVKSLENELIRYAYWHSKIDAKAIAGAQAKGKTALRIHSNNILRKKMWSAKNSYDWGQTPYAGKEIVNYARHATCTCCRKCLETWHNIKGSEELTEKQLEFCTNLVMAYIEARVPNLQD